MTKLVFDTERVRPLVEHARASKKWSKTFGEKGRAKPALWLVKDEGIYLMSNGLPRQMADGTNATSPDQQGESLIAYARGFDPRVGDRMDVWYAAREAVGGDDFADSLPIEWFEKALATGRSTLVLDVKGDSIEMLV